MGNIGRMEPKLPLKCRDVSWTSLPTPSSKSFSKAEKIGGTKSFRGCAQKSIRGAKKVDPFSLFLDNNFFWDAI